jgi:hypothetical protein
MIDKQALLDEIESLKNSFVQETKLTVKEFCILAFCIYYTEIFILESKQWASFNMSLEEVKHYFTVADVSRYLTFRYSSPKYVIIFPYLSLDDYVYYYELRKNNVPS